MPHLATHESNHSDESKRHHRLRRDSSRANGGVRERGTVPLGPVARPMSGKLHLLFEASRVMNFGAMCDARSKPCFRRIFQESPKVTCAVGQSHESCHRRFFEVWTSRFCFYFLESHLRSSEGVRPQCSHATNVPHSSNARAQKRVPRWKNVWFFLSLEGLEACILEVVDRQTLCRWSKSHPTKRS